MNYLSVVLPLCSALASAACARELPVAAFFRNYQYREVSLSPDGTYLAALSPDKERVGLAITDLKDRRANWAFAQADADVASFVWATNDRLLFKLAKEGHTVRGLFAVNRDGSKQVALVPAGDGRTRFLCKLPGSTNEVLVVSLSPARRNARTGFYFPNVERMNIFSGSMTREVTNPGDIVSWVLDHEGRIRAGVAVDDNLYKLLYRDSEDSAWRMIAQFDALGL